MPDHGADLGEHLIPLLSAKPHVHAMNWVLPYFTESKVAFDMSHYY